MKASFMCRYSNLWEESGRQPQSKPHILTEIPVLDISDGHANMLLGMCLMSDNMGTTASVDE